MKTIDRLTMLNRCINISLLLGHEPTFLYRMVEDLLVADLERMQLDVPDSIKYALS